MSSTNRNAERNDKDYYITPIPVIEFFIKEILKVNPNILDGLILDPTAGGDANNPMSYPIALSNLGFNNIKTIDIREDSKADEIGNYLDIQLDYKPNVIVTNPPFNISREVIEKALDDVEDNGYVIMLLRLNYFGGAKRKNLWDSKMPLYTIVHNKRISFTQDGKTDSIEYAHFIWQKGNYPEFSQLKVI